MVPLAIDVGQIFQAIELDRDTAGVTAAAELAPLQVSHIESENFNRDNGTPRLRLNKEAAIGMIRACDAATLQHGGPSDDVHFLQKGIKEAIHRLDEAVGIGLILNLGVSVHLSG